MSSGKPGIAKKIGKMFNKEAEVPPDQDEIDPDASTIVPNRRDKRRAKRYGQKAGIGAIHDVLRLGARPVRVKRATGQPPWFRQMKYDEMRRKSLEQVQLDRLEPAVGKIAMDLYTAGYKNVWQVTQVESAKEFLQYGQHDSPEVAIQGRDLKRLRAYLVQQRVPVKWEA